MKSLCERHKQPVPGLSWVKTNAYKLLPAVEAARYGKDKAINQLPYAGIIPAGLTFWHKLDGLTPSEA
jgi:hypothetical protein